MSSKNPTPRSTDCERTRVRARPLAIVEPPRPHVADASEAAADARHAPRATGFDVRADLSAEHVALLTAVGALDDEDQASLLAAARSALAGAYVLVLDLRGLTRCEPAGVQAVLTIDELARAAGALLVIRRAPPNVHRAFAEDEAAGRLRFAEPAS